MTFCLYRLIKYRYTQLVKPQRLLSLRLNYSEDGCHSLKEIKETLVGFDAAQSDFKSRSEVISEPSTKLVKAAIIGSPNAGKSTLINSIVGRRIFPVSAKVHTTQCRARAVYNVDDTQIVFLDTPGLVTAKETVRHHLSKSFLSDGEAAVEEADVVGVVHDVTNRLRDRLDSKVLRLLYLYPTKNTVLIMNKVDCIKGKKELLSLCDKLTCKTLGDKFKSVDINEKLTEITVQERIKKVKGWPGFEKVFMVSALEGSGVGDIMEYLLESAKPGHWLFPTTTYTDQKPRRIFEEAVRSKLLDCLPQEIPYNLSVKLEYFETLLDGTFMVVVLVGCATQRLERLVMGKGGSRIKIVAKEAEEDLQNTFHTPVHLRIVVTDKRKCENTKHL